MISNEAVQRVIETLMNRRRDIERHLQYVSTHEVPDKAEKLEAAVHAAREVDARIERLHRQLSEVAA